MSEEVKKKPPAHKVIVDYISRLVSEYKIIENLPFLTTTWENALQKVLQISLMFLGRMHIPHSELEGVKAQLTDILTEIRRLRESRKIGQINASTIETDICNCLTSINQ